MRVLSDRFWSKVDKTETCWIWTGVIQSSGYGSFSSRRGSNLAHRAAYEGLVGPIPLGLVIDHLCMVKVCVNPSHLEPVTQAENLRRARVAAGHFVGGQCSRGHRLTEESTRISGRGRLLCRRCVARHDRIFKLKPGPNGEPSAAVIRKWANSQGIDVHAKGTLPASVRAAYVAFHEVAA